MKKSTAKLQFRKYGQSKVVAILIAIFLLSATVKPISAQNPTEETQDTTQLKDLSDDLNLSAEELEAFSTQAKRKVANFVNYLAVIADIDKSAGMRDMGVKNALKLFIDPDDNKMETSYKYKGVWCVKRRSIRLYLNRLRMIGKYKVVIDTYNLVYMSDFEKDADGKYHATATFYQIYTKYSGEKIRYRDRTTKTVEIVLERIKDDFYGDMRWIVRLGDVKVTETKIG